MSARSKDGAPPEGAIKLLEGYLSEADFSTQLGIDIRTARRWRRAGTGPPFVRLGKGVLYPAAKFQTWLAKRVEGAGR